MLPFIPYKQHPVIIFHCKFYHFCTLPQRVKTGFVYNQIRPLRRQFILILQKHSYRLGGFKVFASQNIHRRIGRCNHMDIFYSTFFQTFAKLLQSGSFSGSGDAAENHKRIFVFQNIIDNFDLGRVVVSIFYF